MNRTARLSLALFVSTLAGGVSPGPAPAGEPSAAYREGLRRTAELRRQRRRERPVAVGAIVPYPLPPALVIRQTAEAHDEVQALLDLLRR